MKYHPILFNGDMVRAILEGRKTQTRRPIQHKPHPHCFYWDMSATSVVSPFGRPGDRLWVRETYATSAWWNDKPLSLAETPGNGYGWPVWYKDGSINLRGRKSLEGGCDFTGIGKWRPSIHMPRWASRITLENSAVRLERVQEISEQDCKHEGLEVDENGDFFAPGCGTSRFHPRTAFMFAWDSIYSKRGLGWNVNPLVWVGGFRKVEY